MVRHFPPTHICIAPLHALPQAPQCSELLFVFTHSPSQNENPPGQLVLHVPPVQLAVPPGGGSQTMSQPPQLSMLVLGLIHTSPQRMYGLWQVKPQVPWLHTGAAFAGAVQPVPQAPQLAVSVLVSVQDPEQLVRLPSQAPPHTPAEQTSPASQALLHMPQCEAFEARLTQLVPHLVSPVLQLIPQAPPTQVALPPLVGGAQTVVQSPQC